MGRQCRDAHRDDSALGGRQGPDRGQELIRSRAVHDPQHRMATLGQAERPLPLKLELDHGVAAEPFDEQLFLALHGLVE